MPNDLANLIAAHLVAAERALSEDEPDRAYEHAKAARRFGSRVGVVREAAGIAAYRAGHFAEALGDLRAARRMTGSDALLPVMADCERGLGRPERALDLVRSPEAERLERSDHIELTIVESGARRDLGQSDAAVVTLQRLPELRDPQRRPWSARLAFAYADALADAGHAAAAVDWFARAMEFDTDGETDASERYAELTGMTIEDIEEDFGEAGDDSDEAGDVEAASRPDVASEDVDTDKAGNAEADVPEAAAEDGPADSPESERNAEHEGVNDPIAADSDEDPGRDGGEAPSDDIARDAAEGSDGDADEETGGREVEASGGDAGDAGVSEQAATGRPESDQPENGRSGDPVAEASAPRPGGDGPDPNSGGDSTAAPTGNDGDGAAISAKEAPGPGIGVGPAFIEPDFGESADVLPESPGRKTDETD
jgi:tetratricopeptide (TPR) repeat protein